MVLLCDISVIFPSLGGFHSHGDIFSPVYGWKNSDISWKSTPKNKDGFWVAMLTRKVLNNGRTYSCGYVFLWDLGMLAVSKALEEEEFKQTLRYNPKTCVLACFAVLIPKIGDFLRILKSQNTILTILSTDLWISNQWTNPYTLGVWTTPSTMNLSHNLLLIHCTSKILSRSRHIFFDIRYATLHTYQLSALSLAGRDAKTIHI